MVSALIAYILAEAADVPEGATGHGEFEFGPFILVGAMALVGFFMLLKARGRVNRGRQHTDLSARERVAKVTKSRDIYDNINELMARLADLSRQVNGQLDTRMAKLEKLLADADGKIEKLGEMGGGDAGEAAGGGRAESAAEYARNLAEEVRQVSEPVRGASGSKADGVGSGSASEQVDGGAAARQAVLELAQEGLTSRAIAQRLGRPVGEVELILSLAKKKADKKH